MGKIKVGDEFENKHGSKYRVLEVVNQKKILIEFMDAHKYQRWAQDSEILKNRSVKNPYEPKIFGVGYFGVGKYKSKEGSFHKGFPVCKEYRAWINMLSRCYDPNYITRGAYDGVEVHFDWHNFQTFAEWYNKQLNNYLFDDKPCLDKDLLGDGLLYSKDTCCIIPSKLNSILTKSGKLSQAGLPIGVIARKRSDGTLYYSGLDKERDKKLFENPLDAHELYKEQKLESIYALTDELEGLVDQKVMSAVRSKDFNYLFTPKNK